MWEYCYSKKLNWADNMEKENDLENVDEKLSWVKYRIKTLDIISAKLLEMKFIAEIAKDIHMEYERKEELNKRLNILKDEINALDEESRLRIEDEK